MGNEMDNSSRTENIRGVRRLFRGIRSSTRAAMTAWSIGAVFLGLLAAALFILGVGEFYGYITAATVGNVPAGEFGVLGFLAAGSAVACEVVGRRAPRGH